jgi:hypothetical protein
MVDLMHTYRARVRRDPEDQRFWLATVQDLDATEPSARSLATLHERVRDVIILAADLPDDAQFDIEWEYVTGDAGIDGQLSKLRSGRRQLAELETQITAGTAEAAKRLVLVDGISVREAAVLLGVSPARIGQLTNTAQRRRTAA